MNLPPVKRKLNLVIGVVCLVVAALPPHRLFDLLIAIAAVANLVIAFIGKSSEEIAAEIEAKAAAEEARLAAEGRARVEALLAELDAASAKFQAAVGSDAEAVKANAENLLEQVKTDVNKV